MSIQLLLITPVLDDFARRARFGSGGASDVAALERARTVRAIAALPGGGSCWRSPSSRCRDTALALRLDGREAAHLRDLDLGRWQGRTLEEVAAQEPEAVAGWLSDPTAAPHGGEPLNALLDRAGAWLAQVAAAGSSPVLAVMEPAVVRAAVVHALELPPQAFWRIDARPLTVTELSGHAGRWNLRPGQSLDGPRLGLAPLPPPAAGRGRAGPAADLPPGA
ncbi:histidine phosphatase family protein [Streptomyces sp. NPDC006879]|uniref:histidine phosphatase family protein n=1 Tax=Streptomyces sp. NPDC006879 TaxID=3364767 RepID=UPI0036796698